MPLIQTERLQLRLLRDDDGDAAAMLQLLNEPGFHQFIGDRGVRTVEEAREYVRKHTFGSYAAHGFGMYAIERRSDGAWVGNAGLVRRPGLPSADVGYALLSPYTGQGYAREAVQGVLDYARNTLGLGELRAIVSQGNARSVALLEKLGFDDGGTVVLPGEDEQLLLFVNTPKD